MTILDAKSIAARLIILSNLHDHMFSGLDEPSEDESKEAQQSMLEALKSNGLWQYTTTREKELLVLPSLGSDFAAEAYFGINAQGVLAWCLGLIEGMPPFDTALADPGAPYSDDLLDAIPAPEEFPAEDWTLRPSSEIEKARVEAELWHWRSRTFEFQRSRTLTKDSNKTDIYRDRVREVALLCNSEGRFASIDDDFPVLGKAFNSLSDEEFAKINLICYERHKALNWVSGMAPEGDYDQTPTDT